MGARMITFSEGGAEKDPLLRSVRALRERGQHVAAERLLASAPKELAGSVEVLEEFAAVAIDRCDWEAARERCDALVRAIGSEASFVAAARVRRHLKDYAAAADYAAAGLTLFPESLALLSERARASAGNSGLLPYPPFVGKVARTYLEKRAAKELWRVEAEMVAAFLDRVPATSVLDVPFGTGRFVEEYLRRGLKITGVDISADMFEAAHLSLGHLVERCQLCRGTISRLPFGANAFDLAVCLRLLANNVDFGTAMEGLRELARVTRTAVIVDMKCRREGTDPVFPPQPDETMEARFCLPELIAVLADAGLRVVYSEVIRPIGVAESRLFLLAPSTCSRR